MVNVAIGIVWQMSLIVLPIYFVIRAWRPGAIKPGRSDRHLHLPENQLA
jgi:hypothetical protein